jgi:SAM-dependent methyltransferase
MIDLLECPACTSAEHVILGEMLIHQRNPPQNIQEAGINAVLNCVLQTSTALVKTLQCQTCSHVFLSPTFSDEELNRLYSDQCVKETKLQYRASEECSGKSWAEQNKLPSGDGQLKIESANSYRSKRLCEIVHSVRSRDSIYSILDYGAQTGELTKAFMGSKRLAYDKNIGDLKDENVKAIRDHTGICQMAPYDLIVLSHVLEHVPKPLELLKFLSDQLSHNGLLYLEVPLEYPGSVLKKKAIPLGPHINFFSRQSMHACIETGASLGIAFMRREVAPYGELQMPVIKVIAVKQQPKRSYISYSYKFDILYDSLLLLLARKFRIPF